MYFKLLLNYFCQSLISKENNTKTPTKFCCVGKKYLYNKSVTICICIFMSVFLELHASKILVSEGTEADLKTDTSSFWKMVTITTVRERGIRRYEFSKYTYKENSIALKYPLSISTAFLAIQNPKDWKTEENPRKSTNVAIKIKILQMAEQNLFIPNNMTNVWGLKSEPTHAWILMGNPNCSPSPTERERPKTLWGPVKEQKSWWK